MSFHFQRPFRGVPGLRVDFTETGTSTGFADRGVWSTTRPHATDTPAKWPPRELCYLIVEQRHEPARALGLVLLMIVLAALAFVVAAQG